ncbi:MAG: Xaa-Pro peptidase family protein [Anaerolineae bacterium]|nr:Xaa-Pro peptidase family protein [Anaerolineae bacterium]MDW8072124.1 Xaa-Pro peptidase family protein [Anaerolineae bacterium]
MDRLRRLRQQMHAQGLAALLVSEPHNRRYLSGFTGSAGVLLITHERQGIATDFRYYTQVHQQCPDWELFQVGRDFEGHLAHLLRELGVQGDRVGYEAAHVSVETWRRWSAAVGETATLVDTLGLVEQLRQVKDADELRALRRAIAIAESAWLQLLEVLRPGMSEREIAWQLERIMRTSGADAVAFPPIVASGPNGALPHAAPSERPIQAGEPLVLDFGCVVDGYCSDLTRTVCLGQPCDARYRELWQLVQEAQQAALRGLRAGLSGAEADRLARAVITTAGYGEYFGHGLGHGIGLATHEAPRLNPDSSDVLPAGAVVSVEPGIYLPDWGGVRIEDLVLIHPDGAEVLTQLPAMAVL